MKNEIAAIARTDLNILFRKSSRCWLMVSGLSIADYKTGCSVLIVFFLFTCIYSPGIGSILPAGKLLCSCSGTLKFSSSIVSSVLTSKLSPNWTASSAISVGE